MSRRNDFLNQQAPENYVAGLGRGATGFTTRSDLGPAREGPSEDQIKEALAKRAAQLGQAPPTAYGAPEKKDQDDDDDDRFQDPDNEVGLFANGAYGADDDEADNIFQAIDDKMGKRRKRQREAREQKEREEYERNNPKISQQFSDLKRALGNVTDDDWANIPEAGDYTKKNKRTKQNERQRFYAVPDSVIQGGAGAGFETSISANGDAPGASVNGDEADGTATNFAAFGEARNRVLQVRLDQAAQGESSKGDASIGGTSTNIDPKGYLTSLSKMDAGEVNVGDITRVRGLLGSLTKTNPKNANGWIAAARVEEVAGKINAARRIIAQGCQECPKNEDCWLENMRLNDNYNAKIIAASAIKLNDRSVRLWTEAMKLENDTRSKKRVLRQALDHIPQSVALWKEAVNLEDDEADARLLLHKATEIIPLSVELWLALARLETPEQAQVVLNKARKAVPTSHEIWIAACRLQEQLGENSRVETIMRRAIQALVKESAMLKREEWITEAEKCEEEDAILTCNAIIRETLGYGLDEDDDRKDLWMSEAKESVSRSRYGTARAIYAYTLRIFYHSKSAWLAAADLERNHGNSVSHQELLEKAVEACPQSQELWMELAKEMRQSGRIDDARRVLGRAFNQNQGNEDIWLKAVDLESDNGQVDEARKLLAAARQQAGTDRVWIKSVAFERQFGNTDTALDLVNSGLERYPKAPKLYMMKGQIYQGTGKITEAREAYKTGTRLCPSSADIWLLYSRLEENLGENANSRVNKARAILERARVAVPKNEKLWTETVRLERRAKNLPAAQQNMARAMQDVPAKDSGMLWEEQIWHLEPRNRRKALALEAIKKVDNSAILFVTVARIFWSERRLEKAANWFEKALLLDPDRGDTWGWYFKFLNEHGTREKREDVTNKCLLNEPRHGEIWQQVAKDPKNAHKGVEEILSLVVDLLE